MENRSLQQWLADFEDWLDYLPDAVLVVDSGGQIVLVNHQAEQMFQRSAAELVGQVVETLIPAHHRTTHQQYRQQYGQMPQVRAMGTVTELTALRGDGSEFPVEISLGPIPTSEGAAVFAVIRDLTERRQIESVLREHRAQILAARTIQQQQLPSKPPEVEGYDIAGVLRPAEPAGGDGFDFFSLPNGCLGIVVSDVAGQGLGPVKFMAAMHSRLRRFAETSCDLDQILQGANAMAASESEPPNFATAYLGCLHPTARRWSYSSAGHTAGFILDRRGEVRASMAATSIPLAILSDATFPVSDPITLEDGDMILLPTNGILESRSTVGEPFGAASCLSLIHRLRERPAREILQRLLETVHQFSAGAAQIDDLTAVLIKVGGG
jgi:PAS domain S-box-containing protein